MECARYYLLLSLSFKAFVDWWVFVLQQFPGDVSVHSENSVLHGTQVKISIIALIAANFSLNGPCCHISQQAGGQEHLMVPQMEMKGNREKKKNTQWSSSIQPGGRACNLKKIKRRWDKRRQRLIWFDPYQAPRSGGRLERRGPKFPFECRDILRDSLTASECLGEWTEWTPTKRLCQHQRAMIMSVNKHSEGHSCAHSCASSVK